MKHVALAITVAFCLVFSLATIPSPAAAQGSEAAKKLEALAKQLNLTPDQKVKLLPILEAEAPKLKAIKADTTMPPMQKLEKIRAIHQEADPKVKSILSPAQYEQWQTIRQQEIREMVEKKQAQ